MMVREASFLKVAFFLYIEVNSIVMAKKNFKRLARLIEAAEDEADKAEKKEEETRRRS